MCDKMINNNCEPVCLIIYCQLFCLFYKTERKSTFLYARSVTNLFLDVLFILYAAVVSIIINKVIHCCDVKIDTCSQVDQHDVIY